MFAMETNIQVILPLFTWLPRYQIGSQRGSWLLDTEIKRLGTDWELSLRKGRLESSGFEKVKRFRVPPRVLWQPAHCGVSLGIHSAYMMTTQIVDIVVSGHQTNHRQNLLEAIPGSTQRVGVALTLIAIRVGLNERNNVVVSSSTV